MPLTNKRGYNLIKYLEIGFGSIYAFPGFDQNGAVITVCSSSPVIILVLTAADFGRAAVAYKGGTKEPGTGVGDKIPANPVAVDLLAGSTSARAKVGGRTHLFEGAVLLVNTSIGRSLYCKIIMGMESTMFLYLLGNGGRILAQGLSHILHSHVLIKAFLDKYSVIEG